MAISELDRTLGMLILHQRVITRGELSQCVAALERNPNDSLGPMLVRCGYLSHDRLAGLMQQVQSRLGGVASSHAPNNFAPLGASQQPVHSPQIRSMQSGKFRLDDINPNQAQTTNARAIPQMGTSEHDRMRKQYEGYVLIQLLKNQNLVREDQLRMIYQRNGQDQGAMALAQSLIQANLINPAQINQMVQDLQSKIHACKQCGNCYFVAPTAQPQRFPCRRCNAVVDVPPIGAAPPPPPMNSGFGAMNSGMMPGGMMSGGMMSGGMMSGSMAPGMPGGMASSPMNSGAMNAGFGGQPNGFNPAPNNGFNPSGVATSGFIPANNNGFNPAPAMNPMNSAPMNNGFNGAPLMASQGSAGPGGFAGAPGADFSPLQPMAEAGPGGDTCPETFGEYDIEREIARGGMGVVYLAQHRTDGTKCALKVMLESVSQNPKRLRRFQREIDAHRKLVHDNVVRILDAGKVDDFYFFTMEYVDGKPLDERLKEDLELEIVMEILEKICRATDYAHSMGVVHRDLKPANVLVTKDFIPKLTDFGLAKSTDHVSVLTKTGAVVGTPYYLSPEQASGQSKDVDHRADVYALGVMMYEMITGRLPFTGKTSVELFRKIIHEDPIPPTKIKPQLTEEIERVCLKALEKNPNDRYQSAGALADDIRCLIEGKPISARKPSAVKQWVRRVKKKGLVPLLSGAAVVFALLGGGLFTWHWISSRRAEQQKRVEAEWTGYQGSLTGDKTAIFAALERARQLTRIERGRDALDQVNKAILYLAIMEYRGNFSSNGIKLLQESNDFQDIQEMLEGSRFDEVLEKLATFGIELKEWPAAPKFQENLTRALEDREERKEEIRELKARVWIARGYAKAVLNQPGALERARRDFELVAKFIDSGGALPLIAQGDLLVMEGKLEEAIKQYDNALFNEKEAVEAYLGKARARSLQEEYKKAYETLEMALKEKLSPKGRAQVLAARAIATVQLDKPDRAREDVNEAVKLDPDSYKTWLAQAIVLAEAGDYVAAIQPLRTANKLAKAEMSPEVLLVSARMLMRRRLFRESLKKIDEAVRLAPRSQEARAMRAEVFEFLMEDKRARDEAERVRRQAQKRHWQAKAKALLCLARLYASSNEHGKALKAAREACDAWRESSACQLLHGYLLLHQESPDRAKLEQASKLAKDVIKRGTKSIEGKRLWGLVIEAEQDNTNKAQQKLKEVLRHNKVDPRVLTILAKISSDKETATKYRAKSLEAERDVNLPEGDFLARAYEIVNRPLSPTAKEKSIERGREIKRARAALRKSLFYNPTNVHALTLLGQLALENGLYKEADKLLTKACELNPLFAPAFIYRAELHSGAGGNSSDVKSNQVIQAMAETAKLLNSGDSTAESIMRMRISVEAPFNRKRNKTKPEDFKEILDAYTRILEYDPTNLDLLRRKTRLLNNYVSVLPREQMTQVTKELQSLGNLQKTIRTQRIANHKQLQPTLDSLKAGKSASPNEILDLARQTPRLAIAWEALTMAAVKNNDLPLACAALARASLVAPATGDLAPMVLQLATKKSGLNPDQLLKDTLAKVNLGDRGKPDRIMTNVTKSIVFACLAVTKSGSIRAAEDTINLAIAERPDLPALHILKAAVMVTKKRPEKAQMSLELALTMTANGPYTAIELARVDSSIGDHETAMRLVKLASTKNFDIMPLVEGEFAKTKKDFPEFWKSLGLP